MFYSRLTFFDPSLVALTIPKRFESILYFVQHRSTFYIEWVFMFSIHLRFAFSTVIFVLFVLVFAIYLLALLPIYRVWSLDIRHKFSQIHNISMIFINVCFAKLWILLTNLSLTHCKTNIIEVCLGHSFGSSAHNSSQNL